MIPLRPLLLIATLAVAAGALATVAGRSAVPASSVSEPRPLTYAAIGASDTVGVGAAVPEHENWAAVLYRRLPPGSRLLNLGVSGSIAHQALEQQVPVVLDSDPDLVTVWLAVNDYNARVPLGRYVDDLDTLLQTLHAQTHAVVFVGNLPDLSRLPGANRMNLGDVDRWNAAITEVVVRNGAELVDLRGTWQDVAEHPEYISADGFHPSTLGYARLADVFYAAVARRLELPR
ncbi:MAG: hypothetical protein IT305_14525 [Chloroflexi bacterium]|nr:hypothetical protein [Chloroflexota bacterium]